MTPVATASGPVAERFEAVSRIERPWPRPADRRRRAGGLMALLLLIAATAVISVVFWPGHMNLDSLDEWKQAQAGRYTDWHTPALSALWHVLIVAGLRSPGWVLAGGVLTFLIGIYLLLRVRLPRPWATAGAVLVFAFPPVLGFGVEVGADAWVTALLVCGFGLAARSARASGWARAALLVLAVVCAGLAQAARQNALPSVLALLVAVFLVALRPRRRDWLKLLETGAAAAAIAALTVGLLLGTQRLVLPVSVEHPEQATYKYDLVNLSVREGVVLLPADVYPRQDLTYLKAQSSALSVDALMFSSHPAIPSVLVGGQFDSLRRAWLEAIARRPLDYVRMRLHAALWLLAIDGAAIWAYQAPPQPEQSGLSPAHPTIYRTAMRWVAAGTVADRSGANFGGPLQRVWLQGPVVLLLAAAWFLARRRREDAVVGLLAVAMLAYAAVIAMLAPAILYRYMFPTVVAGTVLGLLLAVDAAGLLWRVGRRPGRGSRRPATAG